MTEIRYALDLLGRLPAYGGEKVRLLTIIDGDSAVLRKLTMADGSPAITNEPLHHVSRDGDAYLFECAEASYLLSAVHCSCGMGAVAYAPITRPDEELVAVRTPSWLKE